MKLSEVPAGRILVQFDPYEETQGLIYVPESRFSRKKEVATVLLVGAPMPREGGLLESPCMVGQRVWVHPAFGDLWQDGDEAGGAMRSYSFLEIRGIVAEEAASL